MSKELLLSVQCEDQELAAQVAAWLIITFRKMGNQPAVLTNDEARIARVGQDEWVLGQALGAAAQDLKVTVSDLPAKAYVVNTMVLPEALHVTPPAPIQGAVLLDAAGEAVK